MNWRDRILADWPNDPQRAAKAQGALRDLEAAIAALASMGHALHVEEGHQPLPTPSFPRKVFHIRAGEREVRCQADLDELGPDWHNTMEEARHDAGLIKQYQRGGIFDRNLPADPLPPDQRKVAEALRTAEAERERIEVHALAARTRAANRRKANGVNMPGTHE